MEITKFKLMKLAAICFAGVCAVVLVLYVIGLIISPKMLVSDEISVFGRRYTATLKNQFERSEILSEETLGIPVFDTLKVIDSKSYFAGPIAISLAAMSVYFPSKPDCQPVDGTRSIILLGNDTILNTNCSHYQKSFKNQILISLIRSRFGDAFQRIPEFNKESNCHFCGKTR